MFLKRLTLKGFKSFAEPTTLELEPGVTVVVGPNGSGKSNVVDAVAWVLGAQGPRTVRSTKMEDVIFAGSGRRPALGRAEVSLTIDNASGRLPIGLSEVTVTRTLWRSGESEYAINGASCRLLDVQELLSDSGMGRQQHVIVGQGQLDAVLNARPEERRLIVEEAAGVLKYRRRRERTERRLAGTDTDLARLQDLIREVRRQLRPLGRQAEAARRHDALAAEHRALRVHLAGRELVEARARVEAAAASSTDLLARRAQLRTRLSALDEAVAGAEADIARHRVDGLSVAIGRLQGLRERGLGLAAVVDERQRSVARSLDASGEVALVAALEAEAAGVERELERTGRAAEELGQTMAELEEAESRLARERGASERGASEAGTVPVQLALAGGRLPEPALPISTGVTEAASELRGRLGALRHAVSRDRAEVAGAEASLAGLADKMGQLSEQVLTERARLQEAELAERRLAGALEVASRRREAAREADEAAAGEARSLSLESRAWEARVEALALALDQLRSRGGGAQLVGAPGVLGTLAELVEVDDGFEAAFEAALGDTLAAVVASGVDLAAAALGRLEAGGADGTVLAAPACSGGLETGSTGAGPASAVPGSEAAVPGPAGVAPAGASPVLAHVRGTAPGVAEVLARLLASVVVVEGSWRSALGVVLEHPDLVVVTRSGDRLGPEGWRLGRPGSGATGAALAEARVQAGVAGQAATEVEVRRAAAASELAEARRAEVEAEAVLRHSQATRLQATEVLARLEAGLSTVEAEHQSMTAQLARLVARAERDEAEVSQLEPRLSAAEATEEAAREAAVRARELRRRWDGQAGAIRARRRALDLRAAGLEERRSLLVARLVEIDRGLGQAIRAREDAVRKRRGWETAALATTRLARALAAIVEALDAEIAQLDRERRRRAAVVEERHGTLARRRQERLALERSLVEVQERAQRAEIHEAETRLREEALVEALRRDLDVDAQEAMSAPVPELPAGVGPAQRARELDRELRLMGPVNPLAVTELEALEERARFLDGQLEDVKAARRELTKVMGAIDLQIAGVFADAYADVSRHFSDLVTTLFPGGSGSLSLTDPSALLETGIEVSARPAGKNVRKLSLLSGGERALVALAFLCAVFRSRPSPFYLMDEVEAALDDVNLHRFLNLVREFQGDAQLVIVTHQRRTMEAADSLYGVSMQPGGSSRVVSERARTRA